MSRIHEALKKAEQERSVNQATGFPAITDPSPIGEVPGNAASMPGESMASEGVGRPLMGGPFSLDALLRCPQVEWKPEPDTVLFMNGSDDDAYGTEEFRTLRSRLYSIREKIALKTVLITSALPKEGKSFTSVNLAQVMVRQHGRRALLIDGDMRGPQLHRMLGTSQGPGLSDYLMGRCDEFSIIQRGPLDNLFFIPCGSNLENPAELVGNGRLKMLMQRLGPLFDWIILDSPPTIPVSDATVMAKACDGVLLVVRSNSTPADVARKARQEFPDEALVGIVLNGTDRKTVPYSRYYGDYEKKGSTTKP